MVAKFAPLFLAALAFSALGTSAASAACGDPPAPPRSLRIEALKMRPDINPRIAAITLHWENRASEDKVCFIVEATGPGNWHKVDHTSSCGPGGKGWSKSMNFLGLIPDSKYCFRVRAWTGSLGGDCQSPWTGWVCGNTQIGNSRVCDDYAKKAVDIHRMARDFYKCSADVLTGPRWTASFEQHKDWCMGATPQQRGFEQSERNRIMQACRVTAAMPQGVVGITVTQPPRGDSFTIQGTGFAMNARVIIRVSGPAGRPQAITNNFADAKGAFSVVLQGVQVCNKPGTVTFTAEDQDKPASKPVNATCRP